MLLLDVAADEIVIVTKEDIEMKEERGGEQTREQKGKHSRGRLKLHSLWTLGGKQRRKKQNAQGRHPERKKEKKYKRRKTHKHTENAKRGSKKERKEGMKRCLTALQKRET